MECVVIKSRLIASVAYYRNAKKMRVWFHSGRSALHDNVADSAFRNLVNAESPGFYYSNYIRSRVAKPQSRGMLSRRIAFASIISLGMVFASGVSEAGRSGQAITAEMAGAR
jgi:hypothetical protein